jgi:hypothetical protein
MKQSNTERISSSLQRSLEEEATTAAQVLDVQALADLTQIPKATILTMRSRTPEKLPPPFRQRPLRWRRQTVMSWMERQEQEEIARIWRRRSGS